MKKSVHAGISYFAIHSYIEYASTKQSISQGTVGKRISVLLQLTSTIKTNSFYKP